MQNKTLLMVLLIVAFTASGCSYRYDFVVINQTDAAIEVQYSLKRHAPETPGKFVDIDKPAKVMLKEFRKASYDWRELTKEQYEFDNSTGTFTVNVAPNEVLLVDFAYNYQGREDQFDLAAIKIRGAKGSIDLEGHQAQTQFKIEDDTRYILWYR